MKRVVERMKNLHLVDIKAALGCEEEDVVAVVSLKELGNVKADEVRVLEGTWVGDDCESGVVTCELLNKKIEPHLCVYVIVP
jgi:hypothetical protein